MFLLRIASLHFKLLVQFVLIKTSKPKCCDSRYNLGKPI